MSLRHLSAQERKARKRGKRPRMCSCPLNHRHTERTAVCQDCQTCERLWFVQANGPALLEAKEQEVVRLRERLRRIEPALTGTRRLLSTLSEALVLRQADGLAVCRGCEVVLDRNDVHHPFGCWAAEALKSCLPPRRVPQ